MSAILISAVIVNLGGSARVCGRGTLTWNGSGRFVQASVAFVILLGNPIAFSRVLWMDIFWVRLLNPTPQVCVRKLLTVLSKRLRTRYCMGCGAQVRVVPKFSNSVFSFVSSGEALIARSVQRGGIDVCCPEGRYQTIVVLMLLLCCSVCCCCCAPSYLCCSVVDCWLCFSAPLIAQPNARTTLSIFFVGYSHRTHYEFH